MKKLLGLLSVLTITGTSLPSTIAASNYEKIENIKKLNRTKREKMIDNDFGFVEKIYDQKNENWNLLLFLKRNMVFNIIKLFIQNNKDSFIVETKKLITEIKNNSINLSAEAFDDNAIDAFANQIWKKFPYFCDLFVNLGINQNIQIRLDIGNGEWLIHNNKLFQIIGEKTEWEKNEKIIKKIKPYSNKNYPKGIVGYAEKIINTEEKNIISLPLTKFNYIENEINFVEKIYNYHKSIYETLLILTKEKSLAIIKLFVQNNKDNFIVKTKKLITEIKNNSINLSAEAFDDNAIDAFANQIWKKFPYFCDLFVNLGINQNIQIRLDIGNGEWLIHNNKLFQIIGEKTEWEKNEYYQNNNEKNTEKECKNKLNQKYNVIEKWYNNIIKIKINKISYFRISMLFFMIKDKSIFIKKLTALFSTFSSIGSYNLNTEDIKIFAYLIWENFSNYYDTFLKLKNDESIRISYKANYSIQKWSEEDFEYYNEIVDQNNDVVDWQTFNNRKINNNQKEEKVWTSRKNEFKRKKRPNKNEKLILLNDKDLIKIDLLNVIFETNLGTIKDNSKRTILQRLQELNPHIDISQINLKVIDQRSARIMPIKNLNHYTGSVIVNFILNWEDTLMAKNIYDVLGDGNCLFWAVSTAFLLPARNNNEEFQNRFVRLFGRENIQYLIDIQKLLQNFDLQNTDNNQNWYRNVDAINLVTNVFRNRVVDYISAHLDTFRGENNATFRSSILHDPISQRLTSYTEEQRIENYLNNMRLISTWGGSIEIEAMADILNININRHSSILGNEIFTPNNENTNNNIQIFHINENHYNFGLSNQNYNKQQDKSEKKDLKNVIIDTDLGELCDILPETLLMRLHIRNNLYYINELSVEIITNDSAIIFSNEDSTHYKGYQHVYFSNISNKKPLLITKAVKNPPYLKNFKAGDWKKKNIDLRKNFPVNMEFQKKYKWCLIAVLKNILDNSSDCNLKNKSQEWIANYFNSIRPKHNVEKSGLEMYPVYKYLKQNNLFFKSFKFRYSYFDFQNFYFNSFLSKIKQRMTAFQMLIWFSLYLGVPVIFSFHSSTMLHSVLIIGIEPNKDANKTRYLIRDPYPGEDPKRYFIPKSNKDNTEKIINGENFAKLIFESKINPVCLISSQVQGSIFIPFLIKYVKKYFSDELFKNIIEGIPVSKSLITKDTINTESDFQCHDIDIEKWINSFFKQ